MIESKIASVEQSSKRVLCKAQIQCHIKDETGVDYVLVKTVIDSFLNLCKSELSPQGSGKVTLPGILTCQVHARTLPDKKKTEKVPSVRVTIDKEFKSKISSRALKDFPYLTSN
jgi:hypothetical protein